MKKIALISTFCDTEEKINILYENIKILKDLSLDVIVISPIYLPEQIIKISDFVFFTKENPILNWPIRAFTFWKTHLSVDGWVKMHRNVGDYGWAGLYQIKKMSQIALNYDYDIFYHLIYDLEIDEYVKNSIINNDVNLIHPRLNPKDSNEMWEATLHFMIFDREKMKQVTDAIILEDYLSTDGVAEGQALKWSKMFNIKLSDTPVKDKIYYWEDVDFFNYSKNTNYKIFFGKTDETHYFTNEDGKKEKLLTPNVRIYLYDFKETQNLQFNINNILFEEKIGENKLIEYEINSMEISSFKIKDNQQEWDYTKVFEKINRNLIAYEK